MVPSINSPHSSDAKDAENIAAVYIGTYNWYTNLPSSYKS